MLVRMFFRTRLKLDHTTKPIVATLHTTFSRNARPAIQNIILRRLVDQSSTAFVLSPQSRDTLCAALDLPTDAVAVVPHGVPNISFTAIAAPSKNQPWRFCAVGFCRTAHLASQGRTSRHLKQKTRHLLGPRAVYH